MDQTSKNPVLVILAFIAIYVIWGSTYLLNKIAVTELDPFMLAAIRFIVSGCLIFIIAIISGRSIAITKKQAVNTAIAGFLFLSFGNGVVVWALRYVDTSFAALEISSQPLIVLLLMRIFQGKKISPMSLLGVFLGFIGIYLLVSQKSILNQENSVLGMVMIFFCMVSWASASLFVGKADLPKNFFCQHRLPNDFWWYHISFSEYCDWRTMEQPHKLVRKGAVVYGTISDFWKYYSLYLV